jgi:hypothetical protein
MDADRFVEDDAPLGDDELVEWLRRVAAEADPVPEVVLDAARAAISTRDLDGELAVLLADSHAHEEPSGVFEPVRSHTVAQHRPRLLTFAGGGVQIDLELGPRDGVMDVIGQFTGASHGECAIQHACANWQRLDVDELGRFLFSGLPRGPVRVRCRTARAIAVTTAWVTV